MRTCYQYLITHTLVCTYVTLDSSILLCAQVLEDQLRKIDAAQARNLALQRRMRFLVTATTGKAGVSAVRSALKVYIYIYILIYKFFFSFF